ncbi:hypothetical protein COU57_06715 [Candidatus Pacearchaeota archaeon CG10_big_fil_rev_8_21_14_0_10_32_14]|nr:MAG: hypothetical protein COU57_06715 [Candidatus Pacearchaeota archaeon CG10_big_fil_rev_8_21_14_0_10_32_14]
MVERQEESEIEKISQTSSQTIPKVESIDKKYKNFSAINRGKDDPSKYDSCISCGCLAVGSTIILGSVLVLYKMLSE